MLLHIGIREQSRVRKFFLFLFARYVEVPLLRISYHLLRGKYKRFGNPPWVRKIAGKLLGKPFGYLGDTGKPIPYQELLNYLNDLDGLIGVGPCRCRMGHKACHHPLETDIVIRTGYKAWMKAFPKEYRQIDKDEAKRIITHCHQQQMFHMIFVHCPVNLYNEYVICNCCTCGCVPYIINRDLGQHNYPLIDGYYVAVTDKHKCTGDGACINVCPFDARTIIKNKAYINKNCFGCGLCVTACPENAIAMKVLKPSLERDIFGKELQGWHYHWHKQHPPITDRKDDTSKE